MRSWHIFSLAALCLLPVVTAAADEAPTPLEAHVTTPGALVRGGPDASLYPTDALAEGATVEIYEQRPDGWCAIRPPEGSFSWMFAAHLAPIDERLARVDKDDVASRVGSRLSGQRDYVQVRLEQGEIVEILDQEEAGGQQWYKIAPPAGEFRWIQAADLDIGTTAGVTAGEEEVLQVDWQPTADRTTAEATASTTAMTPVTVVPEAAMATAPAANVAVEPIGAAALPLDRQLADLDLRLSQMVAAAPATWDIAPLQQEAQQMLARATTPQEVQDIRTTLQKLDLFAGIHRRYTQAGVLAGATLPNAAAQQPITPIAGVTPNAAAQSTTSGQFDAEGVLRPVISRRPNAPQYAVVNDAGQVISFITATPDMNLQPYLGRRVGVVGQRGYIPEFRRAHVTATRVTPLTDTTIR